MNTVPDPAVGSKQVQFLPFSSNRFQQDPVYGYCASLFFPAPSTWTASLKLCDFVLVLVQEIFVEMGILFSLGGQFAFAEKIYGRREEQTTGLSLFANLVVRCRKSKHPYQPGQR